MGEKNTVVRTMMSAGKHVCIPEHKTYLVRNMSDKRTAVLFWASPNETTSAPAEVSFFFFFFFFFFFTLSSV